MIKLIPKDKTFHIILISVIIVLFGTSIYFRTTRDQDDLKDDFLAQTDKLNAEHALQEVKEQIIPGAIKVPILIYHSVSPHTSLQTPVQIYYDVAPESLDKQFKYLKDNGYTVIGLDFLVDALAQTITLPPKSVVLTFDDGWENQFKYGYPILKKYNYTATFFIYTHAINHGSFLTWKQVRIMDGGGMTIGGHTRTHPYLPDITDPVVLRREIIGGKSVIENRIGKPIDLFAYPYGHYNDQIIEVVKEAGYKAARGVYKGIYHSDKDMYKLKGVEATDDLDKFARDLNG